MADSNVEIRSGVYCDTRTEGSYGEHRQVLVLGDPSDNDGVAAVRASGLAVHQSSDYVFANGVWCPVKYALIQHTYSGDVVSAVSGYHIRVLRYSFISSAEESYQWLSNGSTGISGTLALLPSSGIVEPFSPVGIMQTGTSESLYLYKSGSSNCGGSVTYIEVPA